jgi:hypothetical protein
MMLILFSARTSGQIHRLPASTKTVATLVHGLARNIDWPSSACSRRAVCPLASPCSPWLSQLDLDAVPVRHLLNLALNAARLNYERFAGGGLVPSNRSFQAQTPVVESRRRRG